MRVLVSWNKGPFGADRYEGRSRIPGGGKICRKRMGTTFSGGSVGEGGALKGGKGGGKYEGKSGNGFRTFKNALCWGGNVCCRESVCEK